VTRLIALLEKGKPAVLNVASDWLRLLDNAHEIRAAARTKKQFALATMQVEMLRTWSRRAGEALGVQDNVYERFADGSVMGTDDRTWSNLAWLAAIKRSGSQGLEGLRAVRSGDGTVE